MGESVILGGGCLCGAVRYEVAAGGAEVVDYCHCGQCRKASGAPVSAWLQVEPARFRVVAGAATGFASSAAAMRWFCGACGSPVYMTDAAEKSVGVTLGTLDQPSAVLPTVHGWYGARVEWLSVEDGLPRFLESPPYDL
jgi:hypothetical protein